MTKKSVPWYYRPYIPFVGVILAVATVFFGGLWLDSLKPDPAHQVFVPFEWSCASKYNGGLCHRVGGYDAKGRPWGEAKRPSR